RSDCQPPSGAQALPALSALYLHACGELPGHAPDLSSVHMPASSLFAVRFVQCLNCRAPRRIIPPVTFPRLELLAPRRRGPNQHASVWQGGGDGKRAIGKPILISKIPPLGQRSISHISETASSLPVTILPCLHVADTCRKEYPGYDCGCICPH